jgi:hypothetical protein
VADECVRKCSKPGLEGHTSQVCGGQQYVGSEEYGSAARRESKGMTDWRICREIERACMVLQSHECGSKV